MEAGEIDLLPFLEKPRYFKVPIYQRMYSWKHHHCLELFEDIQKYGNSDNPQAKHFIGSIVYVESGKFDPDKENVRLVIDGQQRLTTIMLLLHAISKEIDRRISEGISVSKDLTKINFLEEYLVNKDENRNSDDYFKLILSQRDKETFKSIITGRGKPSELSEQITSNYNFLKELVARPENDLSIIMAGIRKLQIVVIKLEKHIDNPQLVFESMNSKGELLAETDKIRNFILMGLEPKLQETLYTTYWQPMEKIFRKPNENHFDFFMRHYLTLEFETIINLKKIYPKFKEYAKDKDSEEILLKIKTFAEHYSKIALDKENNQKLKIHFSNFKDLEATIVYPFLLVLYDDYKNGILKIQDFFEILNYCESYVFRLSLGTRSNSRNKAFVHLAKEMLDADKKKNYVKSVKKIFKEFSGLRTFPGNEKFIEDIKRSNMYKGPSKTYWLQKMEMYDREEPMPFEKLTVEHVMPQTLTPEWREELGDNWEQDYKELIDNLGNLTYTAYNSSYSNRSYTEKRNMKKPKGLKYSELFLNEDFRYVETWNRKAIIARAERLAQRAIEVWSFPDIDE